MRALAGRVGRSIVLAVALTSCASTSTARIARVEDGRTVVGAYLPPGDFEALLTLELAEAGPARVAAARAAARRANPYLAARALALSPDDDEVRDAAERLASDCLVAFELALAAGADDDALLARADHCVDARVRLLTEPLASQRPSLTRAYVRAHPDGVPEEFAAVVAGAMARGEDPAALTTYLGAVLGPSRFVEAIAGVRAVDARIADEGLVMLVRGLDTTRLEAVLDQLPVAALALLSASPPEELRLRLAERALALGADDVACALALPAPIGSTRDGIVARCRLPIADAEAREARDRLVEGTHGAAIARD